MGTVPLLYLAVSVSQPLSFSGLASVLLHTCHHFFLSSFPHLSDWAGYMYVIQANPLASLLIGIMVLGGSMRPPRSRALCSGYNYTPDVRFAFLKSSFEKRF